MKILIFILLLFSQICNSQPHYHDNRDSLFLGVERKTLLTYSLAAYSVSSFYVEYQWWWKGNSHPFKYENDGFLNNYSLGVDKIGHFYTSYLYYSITYDLMKWADFDEDNARLIAVIIPGINALSIEIGDGFSTYAFSGVDLASNFLGIGYGFLQQEVPFFKNFKFKWSYYPSGIIPLDNRFRLTDDYDGHMYWMSIDVHNLLPGDLQKYWTKYLNLAIGYGWNNISGRPSWVGTRIFSPGPSARKFAISLDYNLSSIDIDNDALSVLRNLFDHFHYPAPGIRMIEGTTAEVKPLLLN